MNSPKSIPLALQRGAVKKSAIIWVIPIAAALVIGVAAGNYFQPAPSEPIQATVMETPRLLSEFTLQDQNRQPFTKADLTGSWTFLFFGFTHCPDVCPTALLNLKSTLDELKEQAIAPPKVVLVTVDPERDTSEQLKGYVDFFDPTFVGLTGELDQIQALTQSIGVGFSKVAGRSGKADDYQVDHSAYVLLLDPSGNLKAYLSPPHTPQQLAHDYRAITGS
jgi:protein SCO1/2